MDSTSKYLATQLEFVDPAAVLPPDGVPSHPRLANPELKQAANVIVRDAAIAEEPPSIDDGDVEFIPGALGPKVAAALMELCSAAVVKQDLNCEPVFSAGVKPLERQQAHPGEDKMEAVARSLATATSSEPAADKLARSLTGKLVHVHGGWLLLLHCVRVGVIRRAVYPKNGHPAQTGGGAGIHTDQEIGGDPLSSKPRFLRWLLERRWLRILNIWMPVGNMAARPLCIMDTRTLRMQDQVRHRWLDHDGWFYLHHPAQEWWWHSGLGMQPGDAVVFDTLRSPHAAFPLPDEDQLHELREILRKCEAAGDVAGALWAIRLAGARVNWVSPVRRALDVAEEDLVKATSPDDRDALLRALSRLQRQSMEARVVAVGPISGLAFCGFVV